jgi:hypothetical protein
VKSILFLRLPTIMLGQMVRRLDKCLNCGDPREIVSRGLCAKCLMRNRRSDEKRGEPPWLSGPDRSQNRQQRELTRMRVNFSRMLALLEETPTSSLILPTEEYEIIKSLLITGIDRINNLQKLTVNSNLKLTVISGENKEETAEHEFESDTSEE